MLVIGLMGRAGAGKDTVADMICETVDAARFAFATALKQEAAKAYRIDPRIFERREVKELPIRQLALERCVDQAFVAFAGRELGMLGPLTPRTIMQTWGDYRRSQSADYFIGAADVARLVADNARRRVLVATDVRFANEAQWIAKCNSVLWRVERSGLPPVNSHFSEYALRDLHADAAIRNDGSLDELRRCVVDLLGVTLAREARA